MLSLDSISMQLSPNVQSFSINQYSLLFTVIVQFLAYIYTSNKHLHIKKPDHKYGSVSRKEAALREIISHSRIQPYELHMNFKSLCGTRACIEVTLGKGTVFIFVRIIVVSSLNNLNYFVVYRRANDVVI